MGLLLVAATARTSGAESTWEFCVQVSATVQVAPAQIVLNWPQDTYTQPASYTVFRKAPGPSSWGTGTTLPGTTTNYTDTNVTAGTAYEYQIIKTTSQYTGYGYIYAGINVPLTENRGKLLLVVDNTYAANLTNELAVLQQDIIGDGWTITRLDVSRNDSVINIKNLIKAQYNADPAHVKAVFLFGHVPVPYSGNIVPDGHAPDHQGAWPCDGFYGDMDGVWTDNIVNDSSASETRTRNVPGAGKFDQSTFPAPLKLMVGRVDLANLPGRLSWGGTATFPSELELLRNYLKKDHQFRTRQFDLPRRGFVGDYFGERDGEAFAASGWRNFSAFFGATNITTLPGKGTWIPTLKTNTSLWAYGCGAGSFTSIGGPGNSDNYGGDSWNWISSNPSPFSGNLANQSVTTPGLHQHFFWAATSTLAVRTGDVLFAYVYLDPNHMPSEVMLQWNDGSWEHRAYWGANSITYGVSPAPAAASRWVPCHKRANGHAWKFRQARLRWKAAFSMAWPLLYLMAPPRGCQRDLRSTRRKYQAAGDVLASSS